jgi:hypothetical protein
MGGGLFSAREAAYRVVLRTGLGDLESPDAGERRGSGDLLLVRSGHGPTAGAPQWRKQA